MIRPETLALVERIKANDASHLYVKQEMTTWMNTMIAEFEAAWLAAFDLPREEYQAAIDVIKASQDAEFAAIQEATDHLLAETKRLEALLSPYDRAAYDQYRRGKIRLVE